MKTRLGILLVACVALTLPAFGQYTPYFTDQMQSYQSAYWTENYTAGNTLSFNYNSTVGRIEVDGVGSFISKVGVPDGTSSYSVTATVLGTSNTHSVAFDLYLRASSDANYYGSSGTYYLLHYVKGSTSTLVELFRSAGVGTFACLALTYGPKLNDGDTISAMINDNGDIAAYINNAFMLHANDTSLTSGQPGVGISNYYNITNGTTAGTAITNVQLGPAYRTPPGPVTTPTVASYATHIDFQWPAVSDGNGAGIAYYSWYRNYQWVANTSSLTWSDTTVQPGDEYVYTYQVVDMQWNIVTVPITVSAAVAPAGSPNPPDGREIGVRPTGTYWGANGEHIDVLSGNVNYTVPLLTAKGRTGWNVPINLTYNSQNWRQDSGGLWNLGADVGYGYGWKLMAGSILPVYSGSTLVYYSFTDGTGAQYRLSINNGGIWSSPESTYLEYDSNVSPGRLYFKSGQFWVMGCTSAAGEPDQGTMYPTILEDTNGNQIQIQYMSSASARITGITDFRGVYGFSYTYDGSANPNYHLSGITNNIGTSELYTFSITNQTLQAPFSPYTSYGTTKILATITDSGDHTQQSFTYTSDNSATLSYAHLPYGGYLQWTYNNVSYTGGATYQQVQNRYLSKDGVSSTLYPFSHESSTANLHQYTIIDDPGGAGEKYWAFSLSGANTGVVTQFQGRQLPGPVTKTQNDLTWAQDSNGDLYIQSSITTLDPGQSYQAQKRTDQNVDAHGNITQVYQYAFNSLTSPARIYTYQYLTPNTTYHIYDRLTQVSVSWGLGTNWTIVTNTYTSATDSTPSTGPPLWDSTYAASSPRSNMSTSTVPGKYTQYHYNLLGVMTSSYLNNVTTTITPSSTNGYAVPSQVTTGTASETLNWTAFLGLTSATGQNGDQNSTYFDSNGRPSSSTTSFGASTGYSYATAPYTSSNPAWIKSTLNGRWTKTTLDGLGRTVKVEKGDASGTKSQVDSVYDSCGCSPLGKLKQTSLPHAPGAGAVWTTHTYDGIGRTLSVQLPDGASTTTYAYQGNAVTVTDPAGSWKTHTLDAFGRLTQVQEPNPAGGSYYTTYTYDMLDHLTGVSMPRPSGTQTRTFNYTNPTTGQPGVLLLSATNPENGTVTYTYDTYNRLSTVVDAKGQEKSIVYDSMNRITQVHRYVTSGGTYVEDPMQLTTYYYDTNPFNSTYSQNAVGRLAAVQYYGGNCASYTPSSTQSGCDLIQEWYSYSTGGAMVGKKVVLTRGTASGSLAASWTYDNEGRVLSGTYPSWKGCSSCSTVNGSSYTYAYDTMGRLNTMTDTVNTHTLVSGVTYGVDNEVQQMTSGYTTGVNSETRNHNGMFQLTQLQVGSALNISYAYSPTQNNGKIISQSDAISGEQIAYTYDALNRLASAQTTQTGGTQWGQSYTYDGFGNLTDQTVIKGSAPDVHVAYNYLTNRQTGDTADFNGNIGTGYIYDLENRLVQPGSSSTAHYGYDTGSKRVWRGDTGVDEIAFWNSKKLATYQISTSGSVAYFTLTSTRAYFGNKLISTGTYTSSGTGDKVNLAPVVADRLRSIGTFYPYGTERPSATGNDKEKFTGYYRDASTGLDYAKARYHQPGVGRFMTPDPFSGSAKAASPGSWNRYAYGSGDPVNRRDPSGLDDDPIVEMPDVNGGWYTMCLGGDDVSCGADFGPPSEGNVGVVEPSAQEPSAVLLDPNTVDDPGTPPIAYGNACAYSNPCDALESTAQNIFTQAAMDLSTVSVGVRVSVPSTSILDSPAVGSLGWQYDSNTGLTPANSGGGAIQVPTPFPGPGPTPSTTGPLSLTAGSPGGTPTVTVPIVPSIFSVSESSCGKFSYNFGISIFGIVQVQVSPYLNLGCN